MRKEFKYFSFGIIFGFVFCLCLFWLTVSVSASELPEVHEHNDVQNQEYEEQIEVAESMTAEHIEMLDGWSQRMEDVENDVRAELFASGVIVGELADLLQDNVIENDGYTEESWQRYENAVSDAWAVIGNFMLYTNDEVRLVIDELQAAIAGLEYPAGKPSESGGVSSADNGILTGFLAVLVFASGLRTAT